MKNPYDLTEQWLHYLKIIGLQEDKMHPSQVRETKRAFYGGMAHMLVICTDHLSEETQPGAVNRVTKMQDDLKAFWDGEKTKRKTPKNKNLKTKKSKKK